VLDISSARTLLIRTRPARAPEGYPPAVRSQVTALARQLIDHGRTTASVARELGLDRGTLSSWLVDATSDRGSFVPVVVDDLAEEQEPGVSDPVPTRAVVAPPASPAPRPGFALVTPRGYRLEGLDLEEAITVLGRLG